MKYSRYQKPHIISILDCAKGVSAGDKLRTAVQDDEGERRDFVQAGKAGLPAVELLRDEARRQRVNAYDKSALPAAALPRAGRDGIYKRGIGGC